MSLADPETSSSCSLTFVRSVDYRLPAGGAAGGNHEHHLLAAFGLVELADRGFYRIYLRRDAGQRELVTIGRVSVLLVALVAIWLAYDPDNTILGLVANAWAGFGAAFGPVVILSLTWKRLTRNGALAGILVGAGTVLFWIYAPVLAGGATLNSLIYEIVPGFILGGLAAIGVSLAGREPPESVVKNFEDSAAALRAEMAR